MELAVLAAGVDARHLLQLLEQRRVEAAPGKRLGQALGVDADQDCLDAGGDNLGGELLRVAPPQREEHAEAGAPHALLAVGAHVGQVDVAKRDRLDARGARGGERARHGRLVRLVGAGEGQRDLVQRQARGGGLLAQQLRAHAVHGDAPRRLVERRHEADDLDARVAAQRDQRHRGVLAARPAQPDAATAGGCGVGGGGGSVGGGGGGGSRRLLAAADVGVLLLAFISGHCVGYDNALGRLLLLRYVLDRSCFRALQNSFVLSQILTRLDQRVCA